jgi:hypothetical protein
VTRLCDPPLAIEVEVGPDGAPARVTGGPLRGPLRPASRWLADADWWSRPIAREYWKAILTRGDVPSVGRAQQSLRAAYPSDSDLLVEVFHDLHQDAWYLERIYD